MNLLVEYRDELEEEIDSYIRGGHRKRLKQKIVAAKGLSSLDRLLPENQYRELTRKYRDKYYEGCQELEKRIVALVSKLRQNAFFSLLTMTGQPLV